MLMIRPRNALDELRDEHLHVAREHDEVDAARRRAARASLRPPASALVCGVIGKTWNGTPNCVGHRREVRVVADDERDLARQLARAMAQSRSYRQWSSFETKIAMRGTSLVKCSTQDMEKRSASGRNASATASRGQAKAVHLPLDPLQEQVLLSKSVCWSASTMLPSLR